LADSLATATTDLARRFGADPAAWHWGGAHEAVFAHPVLRLVPVLGSLLEGRIATGGDDVTIDRGGMGQRTLESVHGPEFRGVYDLAELDASLFVISPGQSGNPFSRLARNFLTRWRDGTAVMLAPQPTHVATRITLSPGDAADTK